MVASKASRQAPKCTPDHPPYSLMIGAAIQSLSEDGGSREEEISRYIKSKYESLPWGHDKLLPYYLNKLTLLGEFVCKTPGRYLMPEKVKDSTNAKPSARAHANIVEHQDQALTNEPSTAPEQRWQLRRRNKGLPKELLAELGNDKANEEDDDQIYPALYNKKPRETRRTSANAVEPSMIVLALPAQCSSSVPKPHWSPPETKANMTESSALYCKIGSQDKHGAKIENAELKHAPESAGGVTGEIDAKPRRRGRPRKQRPDDLKQ